MELKKRKAASLIACDHCRRLKVKCDGILPCARCSKHSLLCIFSPGKKKLAISSNKKLEDNKVGLAFPLAEKDNVLITSGIINFFLDLYTLKLSQFFNAPQSEVKKFIPFDTLPGKLQIYSALSLHFRGDGNIEAAEKFLKYSLLLSKEVYDDCQSETTIHSAFGLASLATALSAVDMKKANHYMNMSNSLLEDYESLDQQLGAIKFLVAKCNHVLGSKNPPPNFSVMQNYVLGVIDLPTVIISRNPGFRVENYNGLDPGVITKIGILECFYLLRESFIYFDPSMSEISWSINEECLKATVEVPKEIINLCLQFIEKTQDLIVQESAKDPSIKDLDLSYFRAIFYRWAGNQEEAIQAWRKSIEFITTNLVFLSVAPFYQLLGPIFYSTYYLLEAGFVDDPVINDSMSVLTRFSTYPTATEVLQYLTKYRETVRSKIQELSDFNLQKEPDIQCSLSSYTPLSSCSGETLMETLVGTQIDTPSSNYLPMDSSYTNNPINSSTSPFQFHSSENNRVIDNFEIPIKQDVTLHELFQNDFSDPFNDIAETFPSWQGSLEIDQSYQSCINQEE